MMQEFQQLSHYIWQNTDKTGKEEMLRKVEVSKEGCNIIT
jgi:hypothetical protein